MHSLPEYTLPIRVLRAVDKLFARSYHHIDLRTPCPLGEHSAHPAILAANHISGLDPVMIQAVCPRLIHWMTAREYLSLPGMGWFFRAVRAIPVNRNGRDQSAVRAAVRVLREGGVLGVFPEGGIATTRALRPMQPGIALIARMSGAPVYPVAIDGSQRNLPMGQCFVQPQRARIAFGEAVTPLPDESAEVSVARLRQALLRLRSEKLGVCERGIN